MKKNNIIRIFLITLTVILSIILIKFMPKLILITTSLEEFKRYILSMGHFGVIILILFQILQTVVAPIPGEVIQIAGGYLYGTPLGTIYNLIGLIIGSSIAFYFTRLIGGKFVKKLIDKKSLKWVTDIMESKKFEIVLFIIFIVPGLPKDFMIYVAGLTALKPIRFFNILVLSRLPWIMVSASVGANINAKNYIVTIIISIIAISCFFVGMIYKEKIVEKLSKENMKLDMQQTNKFILGGSTMIKKCIPNILTFLNLAFGILSIIEVNNKNYFFATIFIISAALVDRYDGRIARALNVSSEIGKELDSLADMISFGVAPAFLILFKFELNNSLIGIMIIILYVICGCYRLAKYNVSTFDGVFSGVPITICGSILALISLLNIEYKITIALFVFSLAYLMISKLKLKKV